jgi:hypothetical protein
VKSVVIVLIVAAVVAAAGAGVYLVTANGGGDDTSGKDGGGDTPAVDPEVADMGLVLTVDGVRVDVVWEDNPSVGALKGLAKSTLTVDMERYGGFEQTGKMKSLIVRNDSWMDVGSGDVVLYNGNQICLYFDDNAYNFTRLGKISGMSEPEIRAMLDKPSVTAVLTLE